MIDLSKLPRPEPAGGAAAYEAERAARLAAYPACRENWERYQASSRRIAEPDYLPVRIDIENVSRCNFACTMCVVSTWPKGQRAADMPLAEYAKLIDEQEGLTEIKLNGLGEPTLQGDVFFEMIRYARARRIWVRVTTNASLLHLRDNYKKLIDSGVNEIDISVDGADAPTFEGIRIQSDFNRVAANCKLLNAYAKEQGRPSAKMWTLVQKGNVAGIERHPAFAAWLGFEHLVFSLNLHGWGSEGMAERNRGVAVDGELGVEKLQNLMLLGALHGVRVAFWVVNDKFDASKPEKLCPWPFERALVTSDLRNVPCCMIGNPDSFELGYKKPLIDAWNAADYKAFRQAHLDGKIPGVCTGCYK